MLNNVAPMILSPSLALSGPDELLERSASSVVDLGMYAVAITLDRDPTTCTP